MENTKLSTKEYWDEVLEGVKLPRINSEKQYNNRVLMNFMDEVLKNEEGKTFMEIGAGSSGWLPYFAQKYNLKVSGLDYSEVGCRICEENLKMLNINYGEIINTDFFKPNYTDGKKYDIVFSPGVIEHFENTQQVIAVFNEILNINGVIISIVPNLNGFHGILSRIFIPEIYKMHQVITKKQLQTYHENNGLKNIKTNYVGTFSLKIVPWENSEHWLFKANSLQRKSCLWVINVIDTIVTKTLRLFNLEIPNKFFSPFVVGIYRK